MAFDVHEIFTALDKVQVRYVVVGGLAVILHGHIRLTQDLDLVIDLEPGNCRKALAALEGIGLKPRLPVVMQDFADPRKREDWYQNRHMQVFQLWDPRNPQRSIDVFVREPLKFADLWRDSVVKVYDGMTIRIASIAHLIAMKSGTQRVRDRDDIEKLQEIQRQLSGSESTSP
ncbi:MAG: hypothetical protein KGL13_04230 [Gammaproteobacteria bacterium]|nr:hypothetical protein [Gammaproteobacteria bacterium]MDE2345656.1 hypothetical protein [Gammaproteobacteria bacterium]